MKMFCLSIQPRIFRASKPSTDNVTISTYSRIRACLFVAIAILLAQPAFVSAQTAQTAAKNKPQQIAQTMAKNEAQPTAQTMAKEAQDAAAQHDGQHDFDWMIGTWKGSLKKLVHPLTGSNTWVEFDATQVTRKVWGGRANLDEFTADSAATNTHIEGLTLRLYNPETKQWSIYWVNMKKGTLGLPATVGRYNNGRGEFYDQEEYEGKQITVRYVWSDITPNSARFEQSFSADGGKTWEVNWISVINRVKE